MFVCEECKKRTATPPRTSITGRELCSDCHTRLLGAAAGVLAAGPGAPIETTLSSAIATSGAFARLRKLFGRSAGEQQ